MAGKVLAESRCEGGHVFSLSVLKMFCSSCAENCPLEAKYCHKCGHRLQQNATEAIASVDELIKRYFYCGYPYQAIVGLLEKHDRVRIHARTLKRELKDLGLKRKAGNHDKDTVRELVNQEMQGAGSLA